MCDNEHVGAYMSEAARDDPFIVSLAQQSELSLVAPLVDAQTDTQEGPKYVFDSRAFLELIDQEHLQTSVGILIRLLEQFGSLPSELDQVATDITKRQQLIDLITRAKDIFDKTYVDPTSPIGINKRLVGDLFDHTEPYDNSPELLALAELGNQTGPNVIIKRADGTAILQNYKPLVNEAEYLYRMILNKGV